MLSGNSAQASSLYDELAAGKLNGAVPDADIPAEGAEEAQYYRRRYWGAPRWRNRYWRRRRWYRPVRRCWWRRNRWGRLVRVCRW